MPNRNNLPNPNEAEQNPTTTGSIYIVAVMIRFAEQQIPLSQPVTDERTIDPQDLTNQQTNTNLVHQPDHHEATRQAIDCLIFLVYGFLVYQCWPLLIFDYIAYQLLTYNSQPGVNSPESQSLYSIIQSQHAYNPNRNAEAEGRTAQPTEEDITFSDTIEVLDHAPFGTPNTQLHDTAVLVGLNNTRQTDDITNIEDGNINTNEIITINTQNETNVPMMTDEHNVPQTAVDNPGCNINPLDSVEPQDDHHSSDDSNGEDPLMSSGSGFDSDDEDDSADDIEQTGRTSPIIEDLPNSIQNNRPLNQTNTVYEQPATTVPLHNEAVEIEPVVAILADGTQPVITPRIRSKRILIPKLRNLVRPNSESSDEHIA